VSQVGPRAKDFTFAGNEVFWFEDKGLFSFNLILRNQSQINFPQELRVAEWNKIAFSPSGEIVAILKKNNELIIWDRPTGKITSLGEGITHFTFSPDSKKIAFATETGSLSVYGVKDGAQEEKYILESVSSPWTRIKEISWHEDNNYLFLEDEQSKLYFVEVNDYPPVNVVEAAVLIKNFVYNKDDNSLYWEDSGGIWRVKL
jgi:WD40 repeat protein